MGTQSIWTPPTGAWVQSFVAGADLSAKQFHFVKHDSTAGQVVLCGDGEAACGILINTPESGENASVVTFGPARIKLGGTVANGAYVDSDASGTAVTKSASTALSSARISYGFGSAGVGTSGSSGDIVDCIFFPSAPTA